MTNKEKLIVKKLGYSTFVLYNYIKYNSTFSNKDMEYELGMSKESRYRALRNLKNKNIIKVDGYAYNRFFQIMDEKDWSL
jgi:Mn-dependent DtxR family transcriptional regulator